MVHVDRSRSLVPHSLRVQEEDTGISSVPHMPTSPDAVEDDWRTHLEAPCVEGNLWHTQSAARLVAHMTVRV